MTNCANFIRNCIYAVQTRHGNTNFSNYIDNRKDDKTIEAVFEEVRAMKNRVELFTDSTGLVYSAAENDDCDGLNVFVVMGDRDEMVDHGIRSLTFYVDDSFGIRVKLRYGTEDEEQQYHYNVTSSIRTMGLPSENSQVVGINKNFLLREYTRRLEKSL